MLWLITCPFNVHLITKYYRRQQIMEAVKREFFLGRYSKNERVSKALKLHRIFMIYKNTTILSLLVTTICWMKPTINNDIPPNCDPMLRYCFQYQDNSVSLDNQFTCRVHKSKTEPMTCVSSKTKNTTNKRYIQHTLTFSEVYQWWNLSLRGALWSEHSHTEIPVAWMTVSCYLLSSVLDSGGSVMKLQALLRLFDEAAAVEVERCFAFVCRRERFWNILIAEWTLSSKE